ncbi:hypothetical protein TraAM80_07613 [Trypanosoma rangeli]|uniref:SH3 domain-containing protein n=1 Tax=Trypanosoma rangeli TaxID=5698 RepID=A0A3R7RDU1_TRYRA|nr:uncharacterized protein TraAM80_07613 [Trypanosoma rangeli]RNF00605.1 hypothetical protein TraAM80_07613 [Trypanosoma rangeli]|eukprot:RNF00605.1 hypothetical protein TraAM80_07613 [Trypanosoma rangeli]
MRVFQASHDYVNTDRHYLPLFKDDLVLTLEEHPSGWWTARNVNGAKGIVPSTFLKEFFVCPPIEVLLHEHSIMLAAQRFSVDLSSHAPTPLNHNEVLQQWETPCVMTTLTELERGVGDLLLQRETARRGLLEGLEALEGDTRESFRDESRWDKEVATSRLELGTLRQRMDTLEAHEKQVRSELGILRDTVLRSRCQAPVRLLRLVGEFLGEAAGFPSKVALYLEALRSKLRRHHRDVQMTEAKLSLLSKSVQELECTCREGNKLLSSRISLRDAKISAWLGFWLDQAETAKDTYLRTKVQSHFSETLRREEEQRLRQLVAEGRAKYIEAEDEFHHWKEKARTTKRLLKEKETLDQLNQAIQQVEDEVHMWRNKLLFAKRHAQQPKKREGEKGRNN